MRLRIHDISRMELDTLPRFNMTLELGLFIGRKRHGDERQRTKTSALAKKYHLFTE